jgi:translation initiation factor 1 (eIF-1/SUI1)
MYITTRFNREEKTLTVIKNFSVKTLAMDMLLETLILLMRCASVCEPHASGFVIRGQRLLPLDHTLEI